MGGDASVAAMRLHVIYRSTDRENLKARPAYYSKDTALLSFLRAREACPEAGDLVFVNNGPIAADRLAMMQAAGTVDPHHDLELHESYWAALRWVERRPWAPGDLVYFAEDDYLYREDALASLVDAARAAARGGLPGAVRDGGAGDAQRRAAARRAARRPRAATRRGAWRIGAHEWHVATSHTSSFAVRAAVLRADPPAAPSRAPLQSAPGTTRWRSPTRATCPTGPRELFSVLANRGAAPLARRRKVTAWRALAHRPGARPPALAAASSSRRGPRSPPTWRAA